nr:tape measure protein [uncultured Agathobaculum sp.]
MPDVSIALSAKDNFSQTLRKLASAANTSVNDVDALQKSLTKLNNTRANLKLDLSRAKSELREAEKRFKATGDAADELALKDKQIEFDNLTSQLKAVSSSAQAAEKNMMSLAGTNSKLSNRATSSKSMLSSLGSALATAGFGDMLSGSLSQAGGALLGSYFGTSNGAAVESLLSGTISGATMGAAAGSIIPGVGTAIGAAVGGAIGAVSGGIEAVTQKFEEADEAFKSYVQEQYNAVQERRAEELSSGSSIAGSREQTQMAFAKALGGDEAADAYLEQVREMASRTNYTYDEITGYTKQLLNSYDPSEIFEVLGDLSDATAGLNLNSSDVSLWVSGLNRMRITDKATMEYLNYFSERGLNVYEALSEALGVQESAVQELVSDGKVSGTTAADAILDYIGELYGGLSDKLAGSYEGLMANIEDMNADLDAAMGDAHNEARKPALEEQLAWLDGDAGDKMADLNAQIGEMQANLENLQEQNYRDVFNGMFTGIIPEDMDEQIAAQVEELHQKYQEAWATIGNATASDAEVLEAQAQLTEAKGEAEALAYSAYMMSDGVDIATQANVALAEGIAAGSGDAWKNAGGTVAEALEDGVLAHWEANKPVLSAPTIQTPTMSISDDTVVRITSDGKKTAIGENRVPRDNTLYLLHEGERVLTAREARAADRKESGGNVVVNMGGNYTVRKDSDIDAIAEAVAARVLAAKSTLRPR